MVLFCRWKEKTNIISSRLQSAYRNALWVCCAATWHFKETEFRKFAGASVADPRQVFEIVKTDVVHSFPASILRLP